MGKPVRKEKELDIVQLKNMKIGELTELAKVAPREQEYEARNRIG